MGFITKVLTGKALDWWREARETIRSADEAVTEIQTMFGDPTLPEKNFAKIQKLTQTGSVADFLAEAERLNMHCLLHQNVL